VFGAGAVEVFQVRSRIGRGSEAAMLVASAAVNNQKSHFFFAFHFRRRVLHRFCGKQRF
jgi:hypothetical protein